MKFLTLDFWYPAKPWTFIRLALAGCILLPLVFLTACNGLTDQEKAQVQALRSQAEALVSAEVARIKTLIKEYEEGSLTLKEVTDEIVHLKTVTDTQLKEINKKVQEIYEAAKNRGTPWWQIVLGLLAAALGVPSPGAHRLVGRLFKKKAATA